MRSEKLLYNGNRIKVHLMNIFSKNIVIYVYFSVTVIKAILFCSIVNHEFLLTTWKQKLERSKTSIDLNSSARPSCPVCNKSFYNSGTLNRHIEIHYLQRKNYKCDMCGKRFSWKNALNAHLRKDHDVDV